jgi:5-methylcytosine-specific restriction endonuclease McrA
VREARERYDQTRGSARERGYTRAWEKFAAAHLAAHPLCSGPHSLCEREGRVTAAVLVDHRIPHKGDPVLFWENEFDSMCTTCHNIKTRKGL